MRILKVASFVVCFVIMLDTVQAQKNKIDPKAVIDHIRETEPELWEKHGGKEYDRSLRNAKPNGEHYWIGNLLIVLAVVGYISYLVASGLSLNESRPSASRHRPEVINYTGQKQNKRKQQQLKKTGSMMELQRKTAEIQKARDEVELDDFAYSEYVTDSRRHSRRL